MAFGITEGLQLASGLGGLFGKKRKNPMALLAQNQAEKASSLADRMEQMAMSYNPSKDAQAAVDKAQASAARTLALRDAELNRRFLSQGGNPSGDTAFTTLRRRSQDDVLNPLYGYVANAEATAKAQRLQALAQAFGARTNAASLATGTYQGTMAPPEDKTASIAMLSQALDAMLAKKKLDASSSVPTGTKKKGFGSSMSWNGYSML